MFETTIAIALEGLISFPVSKSFPLRSDKCSKQNGK
jgi:hypothetical protein